MARKIHSRLKIQGALTAETPLHVGGFGESPDTDLTLAQNGQGDFYIPGTSITGVIRAWCEKTFRDPNDKNKVDAIITQLFGPSHLKGAADGHASFVIIEDIALSKDIQSEIRDGVGIDRIYGTAADQAKFDRAILPKGTELKLEITVEIKAQKQSSPRGKTEKGPTDESDVEFEDRKNRTKAIFGYLLEALQKGELRFGASRTRGLGRVKAENSFSIIEQNLNNQPGVLAILQDGGNSLSIKELQDSDLNIKPIGNSQLEIKITWQPKSTLIVKAGYEGIGVDMLPLTSGSGKDKVSLCLPGSSIKGAFRSHAERIIRTIKPDKFPPKNDFHEQINIDLVNELFGAKKEKNGQASHLGLGALSVGDCYARKSSMTVEDWRKVETGKVTKTVVNEKGGKSEVEVSYNEQELWQALKKIDSDDKDDSTHFKISHHVAIDRWTGGASEGALYSVLQPTSAIKWDNICLAFDFSRLPDEPLKRRVLMLLLLVLRDFAEGRLPLGFATNRGMGEVERVCFKTSGLYEIEWKQDERTFVFKDANLKSELEKEWRAWLGNN